MLSFGSSLGNQFRTFFSASTALRAAWAKKEDKKLTCLYRRYGPSWTLLSFHLPSRSARECRQRWLKVSGALKGLSQPDRFQVYTQGWDPVGNHLIRLPAESISRSPYSLVTAGLRNLPQRISGRRPWTEKERFAVLLGYEQFGRNWQKIAIRIPGRTPRQCEHLMKHIYADFGKKDTSECKIKPMDEDPKLFIPKNPYE